MTWDQHRGSKLRKKLAAEQKLAAKPVAKSATDPKSRTR